jgi:D-xylose transport system substrate-binding protein
MSAIDRRARRRRPIVPLQFVRMLGLAPCLGLVGAACQSTVPSSPSHPPATASSAAPSSTSPAGCRIGVSWSNHNENRISYSFAPALYGALEAGGGDYVAMDAQSSQDDQIAQINKAIDDGIDALVVLPMNPDLIAPALERAVAQGVPVVALEQPVMNPNVLFVGADEVRAGALVAGALLAARPSGRFVVIKGNAIHISSLLLRQGMTQAGLPDVGKSSGTLVNVGETFTPNWDPYVAETEMNEFLERSGNKVDMAFVEDDGMAGGVIAALKEQGLAGKVLVGASGGDTDTHEQALHNVALGLQIVDVAYDLPQEAKAAAEAALALCSNPRVKDVATSAGRPAPFTAPGSITIPAILVEPIAFDRSNLRTAIDRHFGAADYICQDVPPGSVDGC